MPSLSHIEIMCENRFFHWERKQRDHGLWGDCLSLALQNALGWDTALCSNLAGSVVDHGDISMPCGSRIGRRFCITQGFGCQGVKEQATVAQMLCEWESSAARCFSCLHLELMPPSCPASSLMDEGRKKLMEVHRRELSQLICLMWATHFVFLAA